MNDQNINVIDGDSQIGQTRIGLALGSGSARGWAHIGVIQGLAEIGIEPHVVAGSSIGAFVGAAYASGRLQRLEQWVRALSWKDILEYLDLSVRGGGVIQGEKLMQFFPEVLTDVPIDSLARRFGMVATELSSGREVWFREGSLIEGVRASISLPGLFAPVWVNDRWLVDGGLANPVPVSLCRALGADVVIAVNLNGDIVGKHLRKKSNKPISVSQEEKTNTVFLDRISTQLKNSLQDKKETLLSQLFGNNRQMPGLFEVLASSINIMQDRITRSRMAGDPPEVILSPRLAHLGLLEFDEADMAIAEGRACVERMQPMLDKLLAEL
ncbi:MAG: patatin-like phospholipase RssA [Chromatiales bacterium]|jgi:NTE family protein